MFFKDFTASVRAFGQAFALINQLKLWKYFFVPIIIGLITGIVIIAAAWFLADPIGEKISSAWPFDLWKDAILSISKFIGGLLVVIFGVVIFKHVVMAFSAPFMTPLSEKIEIHITGKELNKTDTPKEFMAALVRGIRINIRNLVMEILITLPLLILSLIPVLNLFTAVMLIAVQAYYAGYGNMDYTLERYFNYNETKKFLRENKGIAIGNGFVFHLILLIPVVGIALALPLSAVAATTQTIQKLKSYSPVR